MLVCSLLYNWSGSLLCVWSSRGPLLSKQRVLLLQKEIVFVCMRRIHSRYTDSFHAHEDNMSSASTEDCATSEHKSHALLWKTSVLFKASACVEIVFHTHAVYNKKDWAKATAFAQCQSKFDRDRRKLMFPKRYVFFLRVLVRLPSTSTSTGPWVWAYLLTFGYTSIPNQQKGPGIWRFVLCPFVLCTVR